MRLNMRAQIWYDISNEPEPTERLWAYLGEFQARASFSKGAFKTDNDLFDRGKLSIMISTNGSFNSLGLMTQIQVLVKIIKGTVETYYVCDHLIITDRYVELQGTQYYGEIPT